MRSQAPSQSEGESKGVRLVVLPILVDRLESMREDLSKRFPIVPADVLSVHSNAKPCKALECVVQGKGVRCHNAPESTGGRCSPPLSGKAPEFPRCSMRSAVTIASN